MTAPGAIAAAKSLAVPGQGRTLRIVHVLTRFLRAGSEENTVATALWQAHAGHDVTILHGGEADAGWGPLLAGHVRVRSIPALEHPVRPLADLRALAELRAVYRQLRPDLIHTHQSKAGIVGRIAAHAVPGATVVHGLHILPFEGQGWLGRQVFLAAEKVAARQTDLMIAVSPGVARAWTATGVACRGGVEVVPSGMALDTFRAAVPPQDTEDLRGTGPVVLMLAAFEPRKRHREFLQVWPTVLRAHPGARLLLAGTGPAEADVRSDVVRAGLGDSVRFLGHRPDPGALLAMADVSVLVSAREGLPRVVVQSLAAGCPVIVTAIPGIADLVDHGVNGLVTDARDLSRTAVALARLLNHPAALARLRAGARATDVGAWDIARLGPDTTALCLRAMETRRR